MNHGGGIELLDDGGTLNAVSGFEPLSIIYLRHKDTVFGAEENLALAGSRFFDFAAGYFSR